MDPLASDDDARPVRPNGLAVRRLRHERGWSPRALIVAIRAASESATGVPRTITPILLAGIEDRDETIPYDTLCLVADGFDCDPIDLLSDKAVIPASDREPKLDS